jgi:hypothetical protein
MLRRDRAVSALRQGALMRKAPAASELRRPGGRNVMVCFIQDRAGGSPHVAQGMLKEVSVP